MEQAGQESVAAPRARLLRWYLAAALAAAVTLALAAAGVALSGGRWLPGAPAYRGNVLEPPLETIPFRLRNQDGEAVAWADYGGKVVALTFLYTSCPDACPLVTAKLHRAHELLGRDASGIAFVAVTVDPERDTVEKVRRYSEERDMLGRWDFLVGTEEELHPLWEHYWASPQRVEVLRGETASSEGGKEEVVEHGVPVFLIDSRGRGRIVFGFDFQPEDLVADARTLLRRG